MAEINLERSDLIESNKETISRLAEEHGYERVNSLTDLDLTDEEIGRIRHTRHGNDSNRAYFTSQREDGSKVKVIIQALPNRYIAADIFSPAYSYNPAGNNDWLDVEFTQALDYALTAPAK